MLRALIRRELDDIVRLASSECTAEVTVALEQFIDKVLTIVKVRNDLENK